MIGVRQPAYNSSTSGVLALAWLVPQSRRHTEMKIETDNGEGGGTWHARLTAGAPRCCGCTFGLPFREGV